MIPRHRPPFAARQPNRRRPLAAIPCSRPPSAKQLTNGRAQCPPPASPRKRESLPGTWGLEAEPEAQRERERAKMARKNRGMHPNGKDMLMPRLDSSCCRRDLPGCRTRSGHALPRCATRTQAQHRHRLGGRTEPSRAFRLGWFDGFLQPTRCSYNGAPMPRTGKWNRGSCVSPIVHSPRTHQQQLQCSAAWAGRVWVWVLGVR